MDAVHLVKSTPLIRWACPAHRIRADFAASVFSGGPGLRLSGPPSIQTPQVFGDLFVALLNPLLVVVKQFQTLLQRKQVSLR